MATLVTPLLVSAFTPPWADVLSVACSSDPLLRSLAPPRRLSGRYLRLFVSRCVYLAQLRRLLILPCHDRADSDPCFGSRAQGTFCLLVATHFGCTRFTFIDLLLCWPGSLPTSVSLTPAWLRAFMIITGCAGEPFLPSLALEVPCRMVSSLHEGKGRGRVLGRASLGGGGRGRRDGTTVL